MTNEEAMKALELLLTAHLEGYETILDDNDVKALDLAISALEIIKDLADMDYVHNFQREAPWVVDFCHKVTDIQRRAKEET